MLPDLSIVVAVYNEDPRNLLRLLERLWEVVSGVGLTYEVIFVNDGSRNVTTQALRQIANEVACVKLVELSRNFGQQAAITAGLDHAEGRAIINLDSDLQDPPELIPEMVRRWNEGYDVVYVQRSSRKDRWSKRTSAFLFYRMLGAIASVEIPWDTGDYRLMDRRVVGALRSLPEKTRFLRGLIPWLGFRQIGIPIDRGAREVGQTSYTLRKLLTLAIEGILSLSAAPLFIVPVVGSILFCAGLIAACIVLALPGAQPQLQNNSLLVLFLVIAGVQVLCTGLVAVYLAKVLDEVRARPTYIVGQKLGLGFDRPAENDRPHKNKRESATVASVR